MCDECRQWPHDPRCPNAPDPVPIPVYLCSGCSTEIMDGEDVWEFLGEQFCERCVDKARRTAEAVDY